MPRRSKTSAAPQAEEIVIITAAGVNPRTRELLRDGSYYTSREEAREAVQRLLGFEPLNWVKIVGQGWGYLAIKKSGHWHWYKC